MARSRPRARYLLVSKAEWWDGVVEAAGLAGENLADWIRGAIMQRARREGIQLPEEAIGPVGHPKAKPRPTPPKRPRGRPKKPVK